MFSKACELVRLVGMREVCLKPGSGSAARALQVDFAKQFEDSITAVQASSCRCVEHIRDVSFSMQI